ncbi:hypothetical protein FB45DRAFT_763973 [Roridomyces roridus]|uniref:F-box domain-containing protein n=1 Tax=Roridomyces roridus TaxID=1738132 RepID=A0AAD7B1A1_9AGAR|nr:hypothetical protein FB45DRAFT_763973 [Roridomyces roridus]
MAEINAQIQLLQTELTVHQEKLAEYAYPVLSLPNEIVSDFFVQCLPTYPDCPPLRGPSSPTSLTHICRKWRDIALATPQLWRSILLQAVGNDATLRARLARSGSCPLSIKMQSDQHDSPLHPDIFAAILPHHKRWEYVDLTLEDDEVALLEGIMPLLCELILHVPAGFDLDSTRPSANARDFPRLRTLSLNCSDDLGDWLPWSQLTSLTLKNLHSDNYLSTLSSAVNLLHVTSIDCMQYSQDRVKDVTLPRLEI